jgi:hypothetical protein
MVRPGNSHHVHWPADSAGRQLLREAEPYDDKKVRCHESSKGKKVCVATCYKKHCHKCAIPPQSPLLGLLLESC